MFARAEIPYHIDFAGLPLPPLSGTPRAKHSMKFIMWNSSDRSFQWTIRPVGLDSRSLRNGGGEGRQGMTMHCFTVLGEEGKEGEQAHFPPFPAFPSYP